MAGQRAFLRRAAVTCLVLAGWTRVCPARTISVCADGTGDCPTIQDAIVAAEDGDEVVLEPGSYRSCFTYYGKAITLRSTNPDDPAVVAATVFYSGIVTFNDGEGRDSVLAGVTFDCDGSYAIACFASPKVRNCVFDGAGILVDGDPLVENCTFKNWGVAIDVCGGAPRIDACTMRNEIFGIQCTDGSPTLSRCTVVNNKWAACTLDGHLTIQDSLIRGNGTIDSERGAYTFMLYGGRVSVVGCTITGNIGGFYRYPENWYGPHGPLVLRNTIFWGNAGGPLLPGPAASAAPVDVSYSVVESGYEGTAVLDTDPALLPSGRLGPGSPCIDAGDPGFVPAPGETDFDGQPRVLAGRIDIGADEFTIPGDIDADGYVDMTDLVAMAGSWGKRAGDRGFNQACDLNGDGSVDVIDLLYLAGNWGE
jgi:hypothetical protein